MEKESLKVIIPLDEYEELKKDKQIVYNLLHGKLTAKYQYRFTCCQNGNMWFISEDTLAFQNEMIKALQSEVDHLNEINNVLEEAAWEHKSKSFWQKLFS